MGEGWDEVFNRLSISDIERISFETESKEKIRSFSENNTKGTYNCARCSVPVYSSNDKFVPLEAGIADWPTFRKPISDNVVQIVTKVAFGFKQSQIYCKCGLFLGNFFEDGKECGDNHDDAKNRHSLNSFTLTFVSEVPGDFVPQSKYDTPKDLLPYLLEKGFLPEEDDNINIKYSDNLASSAVIKNNNGNNNNNNSSNQSKNTVNSDEKERAISLPQEPKKSTSSSSTLKYVLVGGVIVGVAAGAFYYFTKKNDK